MATEVFEVSLGQWAYRVGGVYQDWHPEKPGFVAMTKDEAIRLASEAAERIES